MPRAELRELVGLLEERGLSPATSRTVAEELTEHDALAAHLALELGIDREQLANPWAAALSSAISFTIGALLPLVAIVVPPASVRIPVTFVAVLLRSGVDGAVERAPRRVRQVAGDAAPRRRRGVGDGRHLRHRPAAGRRHHVSRSVPRAAATSSRPGPRPRSRPRPLADREPRRRPAVAVWARRPSGRPGRRCRRRARRRRRGRGAASSARCWRSRAARAAAALCRRDAVERRRHGRGRRRRRWRAARAHHGWTRISSSVRRSSTPTPASDPVGWPRSAPSTSRRQAVVVGRRRIAVEVGRPTPRGWSTTSRR